EGGGEGVIDREALDEAGRGAEGGRAVLEEAEAGVKGAEAARGGSAARRTQAEASVKGAEAAVEVARTDVQRATALLQFAKIRSPLDGVITHRTALVGDVALPAEGRKSRPLF